MSELTPKEAIETINAIAAYIEAVNKTTVPIKNSVIADATWVGKNVIEQFRTTIINDKKQTTKS